MGEQMTCKGTLKGHNGWITQIATTPVFPDMLLSASRDKTIIMWQLTREEGQYGIPKRRLNGHSHFVSDVVISSDGQFCLSGSWDGTLRLWDLASGNTTRRFIGHTKDVLSVAFSADNHQIVEYSWYLQVHHPRARSHRMGLLCSILPTSPESRHCLLRLGQIGQGLEPFQLQTEA